jgi:Membrane-associated phospholipid phosphatase
MSPHPRIAPSHHTLALARDEIGAVVAVGLLSVLGLIIVAIVDRAGSAAGVDIDRTVLEALRVPGATHIPIGPLWMIEAGLDLTSLGGLAVLVLFALIAIGFLLIWQRRLSALILAGGLVGGVSLSEGLKALFHRARPPADYQLVETINASFPSGHALMATVFYLSVAVMLARAFPRQKVKTYVMSVAVVLVMIVGLTRIYLGAHWTTDVLGGWAVGAAWAVILWLVDLMLERDVARRHQTPGATST